MSAIAPLGNPDPSLGGAGLKSAGGGTSALYVNDTFEGSVMNHMYFDFSFFGVREW